MFTKKDTEWKSNPYEVPPSFDRKGYKLSIPVSKDWKKAKQRVLIVIDHVDSESLHRGQLFAPNTLANEVLNNILGYAQSLVDNNTFVDASYAAVSFNFFKTYDLNPKLQKASRKICGKRLKQNIKNLRPTHLLIFGDKSAEALLKDAKLKRGWHRKYKKLPTVHTLDFKNTFFSEMDEEADESVVEKAVADCNILGFIARNVATLYNREMIYQVEKVKPAYSLIKDAADFKKYLKRIHHKPFISLDIETDSLETYGTLVLMCQFATSKRKSYILLLDHKDCNMSKRDVKKCKKYLKEFLGKDRPSRKLPILMGQNLGYDLRILREYLKLKIIRHDVWDSMAGDYLLDENKKLLKDYGSNPYRLDEMLMRYGDSVYFDAVFAKDDRVTIKDVDLDVTIDDDPCLLYGATDVQVMFTLKKVQEKQARDLDYNGESYLPMYQKAVTKNYSAHVQVMSHLRSKGAYINKPYYKELLEDDSKIKEAIEEERLTFRNKDSKVLREANKRVLSSSGTPKKGLFGTRWAFDISKKAHKEILFFDTMKLKAISWSRITKKPSLGKAFKEAYKDSVPLVQSLFTLDQLEKLTSSFITPFYNKSSVGDGATDGRLHASYGYAYISTGRSNSFDPSLQQTPTHGAPSKLVKEGVAAPPRHICLAGDYSSHEVRNWGVLSGDPKIAELYIRIQKILSAYRKDPSDENLRRLIEETDIHKIFYEMNTGVPVLEVNDEQRLASKGITFGKIYGKSDASTARDLNREVEEIKEITISFFKKFAKAKGYLDWAGEFSNANFYVPQPLGFRRNLYGFMTGLQSVIAAMIRRSANSPIQGYSSQLGYIGAWNLLKDEQTVSAKFDLELDEILGASAMVHDSSYFDVLYANLFPKIHLVEYHMVAGVKDFVLDEFGFEMNCDLGWDSDIGATWATMKSYRGEVDTNYVKELVMPALDYQNEVMTKYDKRYRNDPKKVWKSMMKTRDKTQKWLDKNRPLAWRDYV